MAYDGYLLKVGSYTITGERYMNYASYEVTREVQDLDSYRDANGVLHRNALDHIPIKVTFETLPGLTNSEMAEFLGNISSNYSIKKERKALVSAYVPEVDEYVTQDMYMAGPALKIRKIDKGVIKYESCKITFIGY